jgi:asparagine synthase (glutamine-hydrolysing)
VGKGWQTLGPTGSGWARGYAFIGDGACLEDDEIAAYLLEHSSRLEETVAAMNGCFAAAIDAIPEPSLITDRYGTIPIYIHRTAQGVYASDEPWKVVETLESPPVLDPMSALDLLRTGYVTGMGTLIRGIDTVAPSSIVAVRRDGLHRTRYWEYGYRPEPLSWNAAEDRLAEVLRRVATRTIRGIESRGYRCALTLSGGLDSRVLASILSTAARDPLLAFSYGMRGDPEIDIAKQVASHLGMPHFEALVTSDYFNDDFIDRSVREVGLTTRFTCGIGARHLEAARSDVMIPGHTGDFISGGHLPAQSGMVRTRDQLQRYLELTHFRYSGSERALRQILRIDYRAHKWKTLESSTEDFDMSQDTLGLIDRWNVENRQRRMILMELRAYEQLGRWMLPFYDNELVDFFAVVPHEFRIAQNLYIQTAKNRLFADGNDRLAGLRRIGSGSMSIDTTSPRRLNRVRRLQPFSGWALQFGLAELRDFARGLRPKPEQVFGTDPIKNWFKNDEGVRNFILDRVGSMDVDLLDSRALRALLLQGSGEERIYNRLLPAALTIQACVDHARDVWSRGRRPSPPG